MVVSPANFSLNVHPSLYIARLISDDLKSRVREVTDKWTSNPADNRWYDQYEVIYHRGQCIVINSVLDDTEGATIQISLGAPSDMD